MNDRALSSWTNIQLGYSDFIIIFIFMSANYFKIKYSNNNEYPINRSTQKQLKLDENSIKPLARWRGRIALHSG